MAAKKDRLKTRRRPSGTFPVLIDDPADAMREVRLAQDALRVAQLRFDEHAEESVAAARKALDDAQAALDACYEPVVVRALPPRHYEDLAGDHPPRDGHKDDEIWNVDTFPRALLLACLERDGWTAGDWESFLDERCSDAEREALYTLAVTINLRVPDPSVGKD